MHTSAYSRGASVLGVLLLLGILSSVAVLLDSQSTAFNTVSQIAGVETVGATRSNTGAVKEATYITQVCSIGYDYVVRLDDKQVPTISVAAIQDPTKKALTLSEAQRCPSIPGNPNDGSASERYCQSAETSNRDGARKDWACRLRVCKDIDTAQKTIVAKPVEGKTMMKCFRTPDVPVGKTLDAKEATKNAEVTAAHQVSDFSLTPEQRKEAESFLSTGNLSTSDHILGAMKQDKVNADKAVELQKIVVDQKAAERDSILKLYERDCSARNSRIIVYDVFDCDGQYSKLNQANQEVTDQQRKLEQYQQQSQYLAGLEKRLEASNSPRSNTTKEICLPGAPGCSNIPKPPPSNNTNTGFVAAPDPFNKFLGDNSGYEQERRELETACRYGNQAACQRLAGGGYGAYGGYPQQSNRCGSGSQPNFGGGLGGVIGGIISLFSRNSGGSSNCTPDGVPLPRCTLTASPTNISGPGQQVTLSWQSNDAFAATLSSGGSVGVNGSQTVQPQQTTTYTLSLQGYRNAQTGQVLSGQCSTRVVVGGTGTSTGSDPKAQIACSPQDADVGMSVAVSFSCLNSNTSSGSGFSTNNQLSGSATPVVTAPSIGSNSVTYGLTCSKEGKTDSAQCTVKVNKTAIVLVANPKNVKTGAEVNVGWVTSGMQSCTVSSPQLSGFTSDNAGDTRVSGIARTSPLTSDATFVLTCTSRSGATKTAEAKVVVSQ